MSDFRCVLIELIRHQLYSLFLLPFGESVMVKSECCEKVNVVLQRFYASTCLHWHAENQTQIRIHVFTLACTCSHGMVFTIAGIHTGMHVFTLCTCSYWHVENVQTSTSTSDSNWRARSHIGMHVYSDCVHVHVFTLASTCSHWHVEIVHVCAARIYMSTCSNWHAESDSMHARLCLSLLH